MQVYPLINLYLSYLYILLNNFIIIFILLNNYLVIYDVTKIYTSFYMNKKY